MINNNLTYTESVYIIIVTNGHGLRIWRGIMDKVDYSIDNNLITINYEKFDKKERKNRMAAMCVAIREQTNMNRKEFSEWLGIPYRTMQDWERGVSEVPDYVLRLIDYKVQNEKKEGRI